MLALHSLRSCTLYSVAGDVFTVPLTGITFRLASVKISQMHESPSYWRFAIAYALHFGQVLLDAMLLHRDTGAVAACPREYD